MSPSPKTIFRNRISTDWKELFPDTEDLIERENTFTMEQFAASVNEFLAFRRYQILPDSHKDWFHTKAQKKAEAEYDEFNKTQKIVSDFDKEVSLFLGDKEES